MTLYPNAIVTWAQEEHKNAGPWMYVQPRMDNILRSHLKERRRVKYVFCAYNFLACATGAILGRPSRDTVLQHYKQYSYSDSKQ